MASYVKYFCMRESRGCLVAMRQSRDLSARVAARNSKPMNSHELKRESRAA